MGNIWGSTLSYEHMTYELQFGHMNYNSYVWNTVCHGTKKSAPMVLKRQQAREARVWSKGVLKNGSRNWDKPNEGSTHCCCWPLTGFLDFRMNFPCASGAGCSTYRDSRVTIPFLRMLLLMSYGCSCPMRRKCTMNWSWSWWMWTSLEHPPDILHFSLCFWKRRLYILKHQDPH